MNTPRSRDFTARISRVILTRMDAAHLTPHTLAAETGIPETTLRRSLLNDRPLTVRELGKVADALDVAASTLCLEAETNHGD